MYKQSKLFWRSANEVGEAGAWRVVSISPASKENSNEISANGYVSEKNLSEQAAMLSKLKKLSPR